MVDFRQPRIHLRVKSGLWIVNPAASFPLIQVHRWTVCALHAALENIPAQPTRQYAKIGHLIASLARIYQEMEHIKLTAFVHLVLTVRFPWYQTQICVSSGSFAPLEHSLLSLVATFPIANAMLALTGKFRKQTILSSAKTGSIVKRVKVATGHRR